MPWLDRDAVLWLRQPSKAWPLKWWTFPGFLFSLERSYQVRWTKGEYPFIRTFECTNKVQYRWLDSLSMLIGFDYIAMHMKKKLLEKTKLTSVIFYTLIGLVSWLPTTEIPLKKKHLKVKQVQCTILQYIENNKIQLVTLYYKHSYQSQIASSAEGQTLKQL